MKQPVIVLEHKENFFFHEPKEDMIFLKNEVFTSEESVVKHHKSIYHQKNCNLADNKADS